MTAAGQRDDLRDAVSVAKLHGLVIPSLVGMAAVVACTIFFWRTFGARTDPVLLGVWLTAMAVAPVATALNVAIYFWRRPSDATLVRVWLPIIRIIVQWLNLCAIISPWLLLPQADAELRGLMLMLYLWFLSTSVMANTDINGGTWVVLFGLPASIGLFLIREGGAHAWLTAVFLGLAGATLFALGRLVRKAETQALEAKWQSERDGEALKSALAAVAAERDAKTRFIASASHDLQQPLQAAQLFFEHAIDSNDDAIRARAIAGARQAFQSTQALIGAMLDHLRLEAGAVRVRSETLTLAPLIAAVAAEHELAAHAAGMRLIALPNRWQVRADSALIQRALGNLVTNAIRHSQGERVLIGARRHRNSVRLWVIDDGKGIVAADRPHLFDDYAQGTDHDSPRGGFGLGLASLRRALVLMEGAAGFDPRWSGGAAFWLELPLADPVNPANMELTCAAA